MARGETEQRLIFIMAEGWRHGLDTAFHARKSAFEAAQSQKKAAISHRFEGIAASFRPASKACGGGKVDDTALARQRVRASSNFGCSIDPAGLQKGFS